MIFYFLLLPAGYFIIRALHEIYYMLDNLEDNGTRNYNYFRNLLQKYDTDYKYMNTNINNINNKLDLLKLNLSKIIGEFNRMKYNMDDINRTEHRHNLENIDKIKNINDKLDSFDEDLKIIKTIYKITIGELKDDIKDNINLLDTKYKTLNNNFIDDKLSNELAFQNIMTKIKENNTYEYKIRFNNINQIIKETNINNIGTNYYFNLCKSNYKNIDKEHKICNYRCNNVINYKISIKNDDNNIIITQADNNYILINISYNLNLTFYKDDLIGSHYDMCYIVPNLDIDNEYPKILKDNELMEYNDTIKLINDNYDSIKILINKFVNKELSRISLEPLITNFLL